MEDINFSSVIKKNQEELTNLIQLSEKLKEISEFSFHQINKMLKDFKILSNKELMFQFLCCINSIANSRPRKLTLYCRFLKSIIQNIKINFTSDELLIIFSNKRIILLLLTEKLIDVQTIINFFVDSIDTLEYFYEELQKSDENWFNTQKGFYPELDIFLKTHNKKQHHEKRNEGQHDDLYARTIRNDDANRVQELVALSNHSFSMPLGSSPYDSINEFTKNANIIEYAAMFGSINVFKYLWMNNAADSSVNLPKYAIRGGNYDIIHISENRHIPYDEECLKEAVKFHRNDIVHYLVESYDIEFTFEVLLESIRSFNYEIFVEFAPCVFQDINEQNNIGICALHAASQSGNLEVVKLLVQIPQLKPNVRDQYGRTPLHLASRAGFMSIVKYLVKYTKVNIESKDKVGNIPIHLASLFCRLDVVKFLSTLQRIDPNIRDRILILISYKGI